MSEPEEIGYGYDDGDDWGFARIYEKDGKYALCEDSGGSGTVQLSTDEYIANLVFKYSSLADILPEAQRSVAVAEAMVEAVERMHSRATAALREFLGLAKVPF